MKEQELDRRDFLRSAIVGSAAAAGATPIRIVADECIIDDVEVGAAGTTFSVAAFSQRRSLTTPLAGWHQAENVALAVANASNVVHGAVGIAGVIVGAVRVRVTKNHLAILIERR